MGRTGKGSVRKRSVRDRDFSSVGSRLDWIKLILSDLRKNKQVDTSLSEKK